MIKSPVKHSHYRRCLNHNYRGPGVYFITINKAETTPPLAYLDKSTTGRTVTRSTRAGDCVSAELKRIGEINPAIQIWSYVIMPDHIHVLLNVNSWITKPLGHYIGLLKGNISRLFWTVNDSINRESFFVKGFNDRIILESDNLANVKRYIADNPRRLLLKQRNPELFTTVSGLIIDDRQFQTIGNIFLLDDFDIQPVRISSKYSPEQLQDWKRRWWRAILNGGVLVSPWIHPDEKHIRDVAIERGGRVIILQEQPFGERFKPAGSLFDLCLEGRLLIIAPVNPINPDKSPSAKIDRPTALYLNDLAVRISKGEIQL